MDDIANSLAEIIAGAVADTHAGPYDLERNLR